MVLRDSQGREERSRQLALDLAPDPRFGVEDFLVSGCNEAAYSMVERWPEWPDRILVLCGPAGAGKSHIGTIWAVRAQAAVTPALPLAAAVTSDLPAAGAILLEDADRRRVPEDQLFNLVNLVRERGAALLITARTPPSAWGLRTADLLSRLRLAPIVEIGAPDEALLRAVLVKLFLDRQLVVDTGLIDYIAVRLDRSFDTARRFVEELDRATLALGRRITRPIAAEVMARLAGEDSQDEDAGREPGA